MDVKKVAAKPYETMFISLTLISILPKKDAIHHSRIKLFVRFIDS